MDTNTAKRPRRARFTLQGGQVRGSDVTLIIEQATTDRGFVTVRPYRSRHAYTVSLAEACLLVMDRAAKQDAAAKGIPVPRAGRGRRAR